MAHKKIKTDIPKLYKAPKKLYPDTVHIFTDGSCEKVETGRKAPGGWAAVLMFNDKRLEIYGGKKATTNNEMELMAIREALKSLKNRKYPVIVYSDSQYCVNCVAVWHNGWRRKGWINSKGEPVKNRQLIEDIIELAGTNTVFKWVKGHIGIVENERADVLAKQGRLEVKKK